MSDLPDRMYGFGGGPERRPVPGRTYIEDPTVLQVAALEYERIWERIGRKVAGGSWFFRAREQVLAEEIPDIRKAFGPQVATRVERAIQCTAKGRLSTAAKKAEADWRRQACRAYLRQRDGKVGWFNRFWLWAFGVHFW